MQMERMELVINKLFDKKNFCKMSSFQYILLLSLISLALSQDACLICQQVTACSRDLFSDPYIDPINNAIQQQVSPYGAPTSISRSSQNNAYSYRFVYGTYAYNAQVDLTQKTFKIQVDSSSNTAPQSSTQKSPAGSTPDMKNSILSKIAGPWAMNISIEQKIKMDIINKYFPTENASCTGITKTPQGYHCIFMRADKTFVHFEVNVSNTNNNLLVSYNIVNETSNNPIINQSKTVNTQNTNPTNSVSSTGAPTLGGYTIISKPSEDKAVLNTLTYLNSQYNNIFNYAVLLSAAKQLVNGNNYQLTFSFNSNSPITYSIIIYEPFQSANYSITSVTMNNISSKPSFDTALTIQQIQSISYYFNSLIKQLSIQVGPTYFSNDTKLTTAYLNDPYYKLIFTNARYSQMVFIVKYNIVENVVEIVQNGTIQADPYEKCSQQFIDSYPFTDYFAYLHAQNAAYCQESFIAIYWNKNNHSLIQVRYQSSNNQTLSVDSDFDSIKAAVKNWKATQKATSSKAILKKGTTFANCLLANPSSCLQCEYRYFLNQGQCQLVQVECSAYNKNGNCQACYQGYYLDNTYICRQANYLCETSDAVGNCLTCYRNYRLSNNKRCIFLAAGADNQYPEQDTNPLCSNWNKNVCLGCTQKCYLNKQNLCRIPDPNCDAFDFLKQTCNVCMASYEFSMSSNTCVPIQRRY